jgi:tetratricopeptide (TPR) repeat protein
VKSPTPALALLLAVSYAVAPHSAAALERALPSRGANPAVVGLLEAADQELRAQRPQQAAAMLERALQIDPRDPTVWYELGRARLELGKFTEAQAMAAKSHSLAENNRTLQTRNAELMAAALQSSGQDPTAHELRVLNPPRSIFAAFQPAGAYADTGVRRERRYGAEPEPRDRWAAADAAMQAALAAQEEARQALGNAQRMWRERAERRSESRTRSAPAPERRSYRNYESNEINRRRR